MDHELTAFSQLIEASERVALFTGAGISTESGIPDFRSPRGGMDETDPNRLRRLHAIRRSQA